MFNKICIIGVGLIGGSIARAAREQGLCNHIVAFGRQKGIKNLQTAKDLGVVDEFYVDIEPAVRDADCIIITTPVGVIEQVFKQLQPFWNEQAIYTDAGSTKGSVIAAAQAVFGEVPANFVPAHPIAGAESSGVQASRVDLY
ncbi:MAG: prephenate dehydrogenase/arogenate dehydrogenase family protein, partial [Methylococcales bacterium]|nr:prephenate dehydrogenase/arogenate dehydrogenase family protein [Methylococcales bacterium]